jgi:hypothetical protein
MTAGDTAASVNGGADAKLELKACTANAADSRGFIASRIRWAGDAVTLGLCDADVVLEDLAGSALAGPRGFFTGRTAGAGDAVTL